MSDIENIIKKVENVEIKKALFSKGFECYGFRDKTAEEIKAEILDILNEHLEEALGNQKTGHWIKDEEMSIMFDIWTCSECGCGGAKHFKYCSYCGAKMKGD